MNNLSEHVVDLYWVDGSCNLNLYQTVPAAGGSVTQQSYATHVWALVDQASGTELGRIAASYPEECVVEVQ